MTTPTAAPPIEVAIIGAGIGGLCAAIRLRAAGITSITVLERSAEPGGTWRDNVYPGCACDVPSHLYSLSFEPNRDWTRPYPQQPEVQAYLLRVVRKYGLNDVIRYHHAVTALHWDAAAQAWQIAVADQPALQARHIITATGPLNKPLLPDVPGIDSFAGAAFHTSQWRHDVDLAGQRIAVVGTGASAVQIVPEIAPRAARLTVFQRTPAWVLPRWDKPYSAFWRQAYARVPGLQRLSRWRIYWFNEFVGMGFMGSATLQNLLRGLSRAHMRRQIPDASLRARLTPDFHPGCKRLLISNSWFPTLQRPDVSLVTQPVARVVPEGVVSADGTLHSCDVIIWGTGFRATEFVTPMRVYGVGGVELSALWRSQPAATQLGITVAGFPNLFMLVGPNTGLGHNSIIFMIESQVNYIVGALRTARARGWTSLHLKPEAQAESYREIQRRMQRTVWATGCRSWYQNADGRIDTLWPGFTWKYWLKTRRFSAVPYLGK